MDKRERKPTALDTAESEIWRKIRISHFMRQRAGGSFARKQQGEKMDKCSDCKFWGGGIFRDEAGAITISPCHRFPPIPIIAPWADEVVSEMPSTEGSDWCGEFKDRALN